MTSLVRMALFANGLPLVLFLLGLRIDGLRKWRAK